MNEELLEKARAAKSPEELLKTAHENGMNDFTEENAKAYFEAIHKSGELSDDEIENAAGGCWTGNGERVVTAGYICPIRDGWECEKCHNSYGKCTCGRSGISLAEDTFGISANFNSQDVCGSCAHSKYTGGKLICTNPDANAC